MVGGLFGGSPKSRNGVTRHACGFGCGWEFSVIDGIDSSKRIGETAYLEHLKAEHDGEQPFDKETFDKFSKLFGGGV